MDTFKDWAGIVAFGLVGLLWTVYLMHIVPKDESGYCVDMGQYSQEEYENGVWSIDGQVLGYSVTEDAECITPR